MNADDTAAEEKNSIFLTRLPVFDHERRLWGYELYGVGSAGVLADASGEESAGIQVANSSYMGLQQILARDKKIILDFSEKGILEDLPYALPPSAAVVKVNESIYANQDIAQPLERLKRDGFLLLVSDFSQNPMCEKLYAMSDILCISVAGLRKDEIGALMADANRYPAMTMAAGVEDPPWYDVCRALGFSLFSGPFFKTPDVIQLRQMTSNEVSRFNILRLLENPEPDMAKLAETIQSDVSVSFRLLAYLNSAAFGFPQKIKSIQHAITMLGWNRIKNWLRVVLLTDVSQHSEAEDLMLMSAQRGKFLERVAADHDYWGFDPESLHLLGLFSLLDVMLGIPMQEIVRHLPLDAKLKSALCGEPNSEYLPLLRLARCFEEARWHDAEKMVQQLNLDKRKVQRAFQQSVAWAAELTHMYAA